MERSTITYQQGLGLQQIEIVAFLTLAHGITIRVSGKLRPGARFMKVPKTIRTRKAICEIAKRLFQKADLLTCFQGNKKKNNCEV